MLQDAVITKKRVSDQVKSILKQSILNGDLKTGDKLPPEVEIAQKYNISKVSAREALRELETEGLIKKKRGIFVMGWETFSLHTLKSKASSIPM